VGLPRLPARLTSQHDDSVTPRVLVVDDSPQFRDVAAALLAERGIELFAQATDGGQALDAVARVCPDGILLDINLPGPDGFTMAAALAVACPRARIVLTSASVGSVPEQLLAGCAAIAFVPKEELPGTDLGALFRPAGT
jgi:CheY-like chemotaxis protein